MIPRSILITGGTGFFGRAFVSRVFRELPEIERLVIFSRDEMKQYQMSQEYPDAEFPQLRFFLGDVRSRDRLTRALEGIDAVVHAAALKQVPAAEYNPIEFINTNIYGAENLIQACIDVGVKRVIALSTDKAAAPVNLYGATKLCSDKLFVAANNFRGSRDLRFSVVRYGNVFGSRGSVVPLFLSRASTGVLPVTHSEMTRFNIVSGDAVATVFWALREALGGEIFVAKCPSYRITDLAEAIGPSCRREIVGLRPGEKIHEEMITESDAFTTIEIGPYYAILPSGGRISPSDYMETLGGKPVSDGFSYHSGRNEEFLGTDEIRRLIRSHIDPDFTPI